MASDPIATSYSPLERLPLLPLELICEYLTCGGTKRRHLLAFSQTSKVCCIATDRERFRHIQVHGNGKHALEESLGRWRGILTVNDRTRHVRGLDISGSMKNSDEERETRAPEPSNAEAIRAQCNEAWNLLLGLISTFPGLKELTWASSDHVPRCILDAMCRNMPKACLHVPDFRLASLHQRPDQTHDIHADDYALASSPNLSSLSASFSEFDSNGNVCYTDEALKHMAAGTAPNLRSVALDVWSAGNSPWLWPAVEAGRPTWQGFFASEGVPVHRNRGSLEKLAFDGTGFPKLAPWGAYLDFSKLRSLQLQTIQHAEDIEELTSMIEQGIFASLQTLSIRAGYDNEELGDNEPMTSASTALFSALPPLRELYVENPVIAETFSALLDKQDASLQKLHLSSIASSEDIDKIRTKCPNIENLYIGVRRSPGDQQEITTYKALGAFTRLETLELDLHYTFDLTEEEERDKSKMAQQLRYELESAAIDADLAQAIFRIILEANQATRPGYLTPFEHLTIEGVGHHEWEHTFATLTDWLSHSYSLERKYADADSHDVLIEEVCLESREERNLKKHVETYMKENFKHYRDGELVRPAWEAIWPEAKGRSDWVEVWHSLPLTTEEQ